MVNNDLESHDHARLRCAAPSPFAFRPSEVYCVSQVQPVVPAAQYSRLEKISLPKRTSGHQPGFISHW